MAANLQSRGLASFGKRFVGQLRRAVHVSVYDKDPDEHVRPIVVPDNVIPAQPEQYWAPHPQTGVFSPTTNHKPASGGEVGLHTNAGPDSALEEKAFFRPLEDLEKPVQP